MKILVCPAPFKGTLTSLEAARAMVAGLKLSVPDAEILCIPLADGGEGTLDVLVPDDRQFSTLVQGPQGESVRARWGLLRDGAALVEMAQASGLHLVDPRANDLFRASTYGTGELIRAAIEKSRRVVVTLGGTATNDAGVGAMQALGARFFAGAQELAIVGDVIARAEKIDLNQFVEARGLEIIAATDVLVPLCGERGATRLFSAQKGATTEVADELERRLLRYANVLLHQFGWDVAKVPGAGAAGGMGVALLAFLGARVTSGVDLVMDHVTFDEKAASVDWIVTGEGRLDEQSMQGKVIAGVLRRRQGRPVAALCGKVALKPEQWRAWGLFRADAVSDSDPSGDAPDLKLTRASEALGQTFFKAS